VRTQAQPSHKNRAIFVLDACKSRLRAHTPEHPPTRAVSLLQHVILFFYSPHCSKAVCVPASRIGIGNLPGQLHPLALSATVTPSRPLVDHLLPTKTAVPKCRLRPRPSKTTTVGGVRVCNQRKPARSQPTRYCGGPIYEVKSSLPYARTPAVPIFGASLSSLEVLVKGSYQRARAPPSS
jgi:hypothetical protein